MPPNMLGNAAALGGLGNLAQLGAGQNPLAQAKVLTPPWPWCPLP